MLMLLVPEMLCAGDGVNVSFSVQEIQIQDTIKTRLSGKSEWGIAAGEVISGEREMNAGSTALTPVIPASLMKLFVTGAVLERNSREPIDLSTIILTNGRISKGKLVGDLVVKGNGNPFLSGKDLLEAVDKIKVLGVKKIAGNIVVDDTLLETRNWKSQYTGPAYGVPSALGLDMHTVSITADGKSKHVMAIEPPNDAVKVSFNPSGKPGIRQIDDLTYEVTGATLDAPLIHKRFSLADPAMYAGGAFLTLLKKSGIKVAGGVRRGNADRFHHGLTRMDTDRNQKDKTSALIQKAKQILNQVSNPVFIRVDQCSSVVNKLVVASGSSDSEGVLSSTKFTEIARIGRADINQLIVDTNKHSLNVAADNLLLLLGAITYGAPGTREKGIQAVNRFLSDVGVPTAGMVIDDGSGVSERNRISAEQMVAFLRAAAGKSWFKTFSESLSRPGMDGRLKDMAYKSERIRAKSGQLRDAFGLAGYVDRVDGKKIAFAYMVNGAGSDIKAASELVPEVLKYLEGQF